MQVSQYFSHQAGRHIEVPLESRARFGVGDVVRHKMFDFRGVVFDIDPIFANSEEWYESIPESIRPGRDQPFYHLFAETLEKVPYIAYVSEQNLVIDDSDTPLSHPDIQEWFNETGRGRYELKKGVAN
mgnify:CR=1 FL=1